MQSPDIRSLQNENASIVAWSLRKDDGEWQAKPKSYATN
jgi:hypothetical protein